MILSTRIRYNVDRINQHMIFEDQAYFVVIEWKTAKRPSQKIFTLKSYCHTVLYYQQHFPPFLPFSIVQYSSLYQVEQVDLQVFLIETLLHLFPFFCATQML